MAKLTSPIGRIVQGNPLVENIQYDDNNQPKINKEGHVVKNWYLNVAFEKANPETISMIQAMYQQAATDFPALFPFGYQPQARQDTQPPIHAGGCIRSDFAYKIIDGDGYDANGKPHSNKEGFKGCFVVRVSTYAGQIRVVNGLRANSPISEVGVGPDHIKTGDYVRVGLDFKGNGWAGASTSKPGIYVNPDVVQLVGFGTLIQGGPDADQVFATQTAYVPAGMSTTPIAASMPQPMNAPGQLGALPQQIPAPQPQIQQQAPAPQPLPQVQQQPQALPTLPVLPNTQLVQNVVAQQPQYVVTPAAAQGGHTLESLRAAGYQDDVLLANGFIQKV